MKDKGFTLIELLITLMIALVIGAVMYTDYSGKKASTNLASMTQQIATLLREAQSRTMAGDQNGTSGNGFWGVQLANATNTKPFYSLFYATSTAGLASASSIGHYSLSSLVSYTTSSIAAGGTLYVYYSSGLSGISPGAYEVCSGYTCPTGTTTIMIGLYMPLQTPVLSSTISIVPTGGVNY